MGRRILALFVLLLAGCAASAQTRPASVNLPVLLAHHPLYGTLAQYDRQIAALQGTLHTRFTTADAAIAHSVAAMQNDLRQARSLHLQLPAPSAPPEVPGAAAVPRSGTVAAHIAQAYRGQAAQLQQSAGQDMAAYRAMLLRQQQDAISTYTASMNAHTQQAYDARAQELREKESQLLLDLARQDAPQRLMLRAKLQTLAMTGQNRAELEHRLQMLQAREDAAVGALRHKNAVTLAAYASKLRAQGARDIASMTSDLQRRTQANIAARERVLSAERAGAPPLQISAAPSQPGRPAEMRAQYRDLLDARNADPAAYSAASSDLAQQFGALRSANDADTQATLSQIASLEHDRTAVRKKMIAQIMSEAQQVAKAQGYSGVYPAKSAPPNSADLTSSVLADLRSLSP